MYCYARDLHHLPCHTSGAVNNCEVYTVHLWAAAHAASLSQRRMKWRPAGTPHSAAIFPVAAAAKSLRGDMLRSSSTRAFLVTASQRPCALTP